MRAFPATEAPIGSDFAKFPVIFPVSREFGPETGSLETAPSARLKAIVFIQEYRREWVTELSAVPRLLRRQGALLRAAERRGRGRRHAKARRYLCLPLL